MNQTTIDTPTISNNKNRESMNILTDMIMLRKSYRLLTVISMMMMSVVAYDASAQCGNQALVCNNLVRVSLDTSCTALITPDVVLKGLNIDTSLYDVEVYDPEGNLIPDDLITDDYDGQRLEVRVYCRGSNLFCWGNIIVEDKIPPTIEITPCDTTLSCAVMPFELDPNALVTSVSFTDEGCEKPDTFSITDFTERVFPCRDTVKIIERVFTTFDAAGNQASKTQTIYLLRAELNEIIFPQDTLIDCLDEADLSPAKLGEPDVGSCDHFEVAMRDDEIITCGVARKILRSWIVNDICTNNDTVVTQVIKIEDNNPPKFTFDNFDIPVDRVETDKFNCTANVLGINNPQITDCNLAQTILTTFYQQSDDDGNLFGPLFPAAVNDMLSDPDDPMTATMVWDLLDVPVGMPFRVIFVADDQCGNIARDTSDIFTLPDTSPPNAVCEGFTTVVLNNEGVTEVFAEVFDDNSFDNCGIVNKEVRRFNTSCPGFEDDESFGPSINFCCEDIANGPVKVVFRVYDGSGGFSDCIVDVFVQDKRPIGITCPSVGLAFECGTDSLTIAEAIMDNAPVVTYVCGEKSLTVDIPSWTEDECGGANFNVVWTAMDLNGQMATCVVPVEIGNLVPANVTPPNLNITLASCGAGTEPDDIPNSRPIVNNADCEKINITWEDQIATGTGSSCITIIRTWSIIDWCQFDGGNVETALLASFEQTINISDNNPPVISDCPTATVIVDDLNESCDEPVTLSIAASDDCTETEDLTYRLAVDLGKDGTEDRVSTTGATVTALYPVGTHAVTWTVTDLCGNVSTCTYDLTINSNKPPVPLCTGLVGVTIGADGTGVLQAEELNVKSVNGCTDSEEDLTFSFSPDGDQPQMVFRCSDLSNGVLVETTVDLFVVDANGNSASCNVIVTLRDGASNTCPDNNVSSVISGRVTNESSDAVEGVPVRAVELASGQTLEVETDADGTYSFPSLSSTTDYRVEPALDGYPLAGVSTLDLVIIQRHILGIAPLDSPYKLLAADVNNSNTISATDLVQLRRLILGLTEELPEQDWKFADTDYDFTQLSTWLYDDHIDVGNTQPMGGDNDFIAMKVGDVSGNAFAALAQIPGFRSISKLIAVQEAKGDVTRWTFSTPAVDEVAGFQLALDLGGKDVVSVGSAQQLLSPENYIIDNDVLRISWSSGSDFMTGTQGLFYIDVRSHGATQDISLSDAMTAEVISRDLSSEDLVLEQSNVITNDGLQLLQNTPNPFGDETNIQFYLPEAGEVEFIVTDLSGKQMYKSTNLYNKGTNTITLTSAQLGHSGIYYYTVIGAGTKQTKRMIVLH